MDNINREKDTVKVYLVAENRLLRETLVRLFHKRSGISVVGEGRFSDSTAQQVDETKCDVLLLDSLEAAKTLVLVDKSSDNATRAKIILFGMTEDASSFLKAVSLGVCGYLLKDSSAAEMVDAVQGVTRGEAFCPPVFCMLLFQLVANDFLQRSSITDQKACLKLGLTYRQRQLVSLVARGMTNKEIAANLNLSEYTVKNHIHRIMRQVDADSRHEAVDVIRASSFLSVS